MIPLDSDRQLYELAEQASANAYVPYCNFHVGAAMKFEDGSVFTGANIDNASYPLALCAERSAIATAVSQGKRKIQTIAVYGEAESVSPCGGCRQVIAEFAAPDCRLTFKWHGTLTTINFSDLLTYAFDFDSQEPR